MCICWSMLECAPRLIFIGCFSCACMTDRQHQQKAEGEKCQLFVLSYLTDLVRVIFSLTRAGYQTRLSDNTS